MFVKTFDCNIKWCIIMGKSANKCHVGPFLKLKILLFTELMADMYKKSSCDTEHYVEIYMYVKSRQ